METIRKENGRKIVRRITEKELKMNAEKHPVKTVAELIEEVAVSVFKVCARVRLQEAGDEEGGAGRLNNSFLKLITQTLTAFSRSLQQSLPGAWLGQTDLPRTFVN